MLNSAERSKLLGCDRLKQLQPISPHFSQLLKDTNLSTARSRQTQIQKPLGVFR